MTHYTEIDNDPNYSRYLDYGFVGLTETMGSDTSIAQSARVSYGKNSSSNDVKRDTTLIRYMFRHRHTSPFEMAEVRFHLKLPIFVMRQHIRHRTANVNEYSGRYSVMSDEFYFPEYEDRNFGQSQINKQLSEGQVPESVYSDFLYASRDLFERSYATYEKAIKGGISREIARIILPISNYTECYWKIDLHNFFHYIKLRNDPGHAQDEIVTLAQLMYNKVKEVFPISCQAFEDYQLNAVTFSASEINVLVDLFDEVFYNESAFDSWSGEDYPELTDRELSEFKMKIKTIIKGRRV